MNSVEFIILSAVAVMYVTFLFIIWKLIYITNKRGTCTSRIVEQARYLEREREKEKQREREKEKVFIDPEILDQNFVDRTRKDYTIYFGVSV